MLHPVVLRKTSFIDFPGLISAVIFFPGCNLRCPWCCNRELVLKTADCIALDHALDHIVKRRRLLGGVVLSGGEPTLFAGLGAVIKQIKAIGLQVKLDTNGLLPGVLEALCISKDTTPDYIAMDVKTAPKRYWELLSQNNAKTPDPAQALERSISLLRSLGIPHEFRSLKLPVMPLSYFGETEKAVLAELIQDSPWNIRPFMAGNCLDPAWDMYETSIE